MWLAFQTGCPNNGILRGILSGKKLHKGSFSQYECQLNLVKGKRAAFCVGESSPRVHTGLVLGVFNSKLWESSMIAAFCLLKRQFLLKSV